MAGPQLEDGYARISNELLEGFARVQLSGYQWRLVMVIIRHTYGWGKKTDQISITQFQKETGLDRRHIARALNDLISRKIIAKNGNTYVATYGIQKDFTQWKLLPKSALIAKNGNETVAKIGTHKRKKENKDSSDFFSLKKRYPFSELIDRCFSAIASTRKNGNVADSVLLAQLHKWERYPVEQVEAGIRTYLEKDHAGQGKDEKYLLGIIRNHNGYKATAGPGKKNPENLFQADWY